MRDVSNRDFSAQTSSGDTGSCPEQDSHVRFVLFVCFLLFTRSL